MRFFRRGSQEPQPPEPAAEPDEVVTPTEPAAPTAVPVAAPDEIFREAEAESAAPDEAADDGPDLIGDEWRTSAAADTIAFTPNELEEDLAEAPGSLLGGGGLVEAAPIIAMPGEVPEPEPPSQPIPEPAPAPQQWAWGSDWSAEKADTARREREHEQLEAGLEKTRSGFGARLRSAFGGIGTDADWEEVEETLITGDVGAALSMSIVEQARKRRDMTVEEAVRAELEAILEGRDSGVWEPVPALDGAPAIVLVVGVNGTGKTTTIGKLAFREHAQGRRVVLAAADTFRAAAIEQLRIWAQRANAEIVAHAQNADPAAVVFDALDAAIARHADILIADTAGRLHTKSNLMDELSKIRRVIDKRLPGARVETLFVLDATTGQNGLAQAKAFHEAVALTGVVLTKLDSTAKGGIVFAIEKDLGVPVRFVGVGEKAEDLLPFDPPGFVAALFD